LKSGKGFLKPNFEPLPSLSDLAAVSNVFNLGRHLANAKYYRTIIH
jgi:hypothetical protein